MELDIKECVNCQSKNIIGHKYQKIICFDCRYRMKIIKGKEERSCSNCDGKDVHFVRDASGHVMCSSCRTKDFPKVIKLEDERIEVSQY